MRKMDNKLFWTLMAGLVMVLTGYPERILGNTGGLQQVTAQQGDKQTQYRDHLNKGDKFLAAKNYAAAMLEYEKASDLMPDEDEPKLKMQSIEATLGIEELAEVKRKVEQAKKEEADQLKKSQQPTAANQTQPQNANFDQFLQDRQAQAKKDSIRKAIFDQFADELRKAEQGSDMLARSKVYKKIADAFNKANDQEIALKYYQKALDIDEKYGQQQNASTVYENMANVYYSSGDFQSSLDNYTKSLTIKEKSGDKEGQSKVLSNIANVYKTTYDYKNAIDYYQQSAKIKENIKDDSGLKDVMNNLGDVYYKQKILASSILSYNKTVGIIQKLNMKEALGPVYNKLGVAHYEMGNYDEAKKFFTESMKNLFESGNRKEASMAVNNLGNLLYLDNKYEDAISYYERSLATKKETNYDYGKAVTMFNLGNAYRRSGNQELAVEYYKKSMRIADSLDLKSLLGKNVKALAASYEALKEFDKSKSFQDKLDSMDLGDVTIEMPISENEMDLDLKKTQEILTKLNEEALKRKDLIENEANNKVTDLYIRGLNKKFTNEQGKNRMLLIATFSLVGILIITIIFLFRAFQKRKKPAKS